MTLDLPCWGFGITSTVPVEIVRELAPIVEQAGFGTLWINHIPGGNCYASMEVAASVTSKLKLGSGVTSLDAMDASTIVQEVRNRDLPDDRLTIGIGASKPPSPLETVARGLDLLHEELSGVPIVVGALGPKMRDLGVAHGDGVLLNWLTPDAARGAMEDRRRDAPESDATVALYTRCSLGAIGAGAMAIEAARYASFPGYAANFARLGFSAMDAAVCVDEPMALVERLSAYQGVVDQPVLRAITGAESLKAYASLVEGARN
ncbi:MAG: LLM class flavin-dependent oxidoreductase [Thermomicrobiales bacterium]|nr:LLM class flavin-dependent oxidoreductase [Thermomicrobiales bacterium]